ncbi:MAG: hypothetical protein ACI8W7_001867 [Gammaproteobacteria bacterium]|jgi:hypothetical protein
MHRSNNNPALNASSLTFVGWLIARLRQQLGSYASLISGAQHRTSGIKVTNKAQHLCMDIDAATRRDLGLPVDHRVRDWGAEFERWSR